MGNSFVTYTLLYSFSYHLMPLYTLNQEAELEMAKSLVNYIHRRYIMPSDLSLTYTQTVWVPVKNIVTYTTYKPQKNKINKVLV